MYIKKSKHNFSYILFILFGLAIILFFGVCYTTNYPQVLGNKTSICQDATGNYIDCICDPLKQICEGGPSPVPNFAPTITPTPPLEPTSEIAPINTPTPTLQIDPTPTNSRPPPLPPTPSPVPTFIPISNVTPVEKGICHWNVTSNIWEALSVPFTNNNHKDHEKDYSYTGPYNVHYSQDQKPANTWCEEYVPNSDGSWCHELSDGSCQDEAGMHHSFHPNNFGGRSVNYDCVGTPLNDSQYANVKCQSREECASWFFLPSGYCSWPIIKSLIK